MKELSIFLKEGISDKTDLNSIKQFIKKNFKGAPKKVGGYFSCNNCESLTSLKGAPKEVGEGFDCGDCKLLTSLEGAPKEVNDNFYVLGCGKEFTEDDVLAVSNVKGKIFIK